MKLGRRKTAGTERRRRSAPQSGGTLSYRSQRVEAEANTGRKEEREVRQPKLRFGWLQRLGYIVLSIVLLISAINILTLSSHAKIVPQNEEATALLRDTAEYEAAATKLLADSTWNRNKITVDTGTVRREMQRQFPELAVVDVTIPWLAHRPLVYVEAVRPAMVLTASDGAYLLDASGTVLTKADTVEALNQPDLPRVSDQSGLRVKIGEQALPATHVQFIEAIRAQLTAKQYTIAAMTLPIATSELDVQVGGEPYYIKFNLQSDTARQQAGTFLATITKLKRENIMPAKYIDVRLAGRAYYQ